MPCFASNIVGSMKKPFSYGLPLSFFPPQMSLAPSSTPISMYLRIFSSCSSLETGPTSTFGSIGSPIFKASVLVNNFPMTSSYTFPWTINRLVAVHLWPAVPKAPKSTPSMARSMLASSIIISGFFPPNSKPTLFIEAEALE